MSVLNGQLVEQKPTKIANQPNIQPASHTSNQPTNIENIIIVLFFIIIMLVMMATMTTLLMMILDKNFIVALFLFKTLKRKTHKLLLNSTQLMKMISLILKLQLLMMLAVRANSFVFCFNCFTF